MYAPGRVPSEIQRVDPCGNPRQNANVLMLAGLSPIKEVMGLNPVDRSAGLRYGDSALGYRCNHLYIHL